MRLQVLELAQGRGGRLFEERALAGQKRRLGDVVANLRRRADRHRIEIRKLQHLAVIRERIFGILRRKAALARHREQLEIRDWPG